MEAKQLESCACVVPKQKMTNNNSTAPVSNPFLFYLCSHYLDSVQDGATALIVAAQNGHVRAVEVLIAGKAKIDIQAKVRFTACLLKSIFD